MISNLYESPNSQSIDTIPSSFLRAVNNLIEVSHS